MSSDLVILYDIPSKDPCKCWSLNPWKTRLILNHKSIPYKTEWTEYPDIKPKLSNLGIKAAQPDANAATYTIPAITLPDGTHIMDSLAIAQRLETLHPSPSLHLESPYLSRVQTTLPEALGNLGPVFAPKVHRIILPERSAEYFGRTRQTRFGMPLEEFEKSAKGGKVAWDAAEPALKEVAGMLREDSSGPFFMGKEVSYADFVVVGFMKMFDRIGEMEGVLKVDREAFGGLYEACAKWLERDDH